MTMRRTILALLTTLLLPLGPARAADWSMGGQNTANTRAQPAETEISPATVGQLRARWATQLHGNVEATPAVSGGAIFVPDDGGYLNKIDPATGQIIWSRPMSEYTGIVGDVARTTPAIADGLLVFGTQSGGPSAVLDAAPRGWQPGQGAFVVAVDAATGDPLWRTRVDTDDAARVNASAIVSGGAVYAGVTSWEETIAALLPGYKCCHFRGSVVKLDLATGKVLWKTAMVPEGYSGGAVWGSTPAIDPDLGLVYVATGNNYTLPDTVAACILEALKTEPRGGSGGRDCQSPDNHVDSIVALDTGTGAVRWTLPTVPFDAHTHACMLPAPNPQNCPSPVGPDYDFGQGPMLFTVKTPDGPRRLVGAGQKSGVFWAADARTGKLVWHTDVGPGGLTGGMQWGSATDGKRIYVALTNADGTRTTLRGDGPYSGQVALRGYWSALDAATGRIIWQTPDPNATAMDQGMVSVANGVVFAGSMAGGAFDPNMFALDAATGRILWRFPGVGSVVAGAAIVDGSVYWGSGYDRWGGIKNDLLYAFDLP